MQEQKSPLAKKKKSRKQNKNIPIVKIARTHSNSYPINVKRTGILPTDF